MRTRTIFSVLFTALSIAALAGCGDSTGAKPDSSGTGSAKPAGSTAGASGSAAPKSGGGW